MHGSHSYANKNLKIPYFRTRYFSLQLQSRGCESFVFYGDLQHPSFAWLFSPLLTDISHLAKFSFCVSARCSQPSDSPQSIQPRVVYCQNDGRGYWASPRFKYIKTQDMGDFSMSVYGIREVDSLRVWSLINYQSDFWFLINLGNNSR